MRERLELLDLPSKEMRERLELLDLSSEGAASWKNSCRKSEVWQNYLTGCCWDDGIYLQGGKLVMPVFCFCPSHCCGPMMWSCPKVCQRCLFFVWGENAECNRTSFFLCLDLSVWKLFCHCLALHYFWVDIMGFEWVCFFCFLSTSKKESLTK